MSYTSLRKRFGRGGNVSSNKIKKIYNEGYTAPGQAYAIAKNMGYAEGVK